MTQKGSARERPGLRAEYRSMLKAIEVEEVLDLVFYRPLAYVLVKLVQPTPVTPNQITFASLLLGLASGWCFGLGTASGLLAGAILLFLTNTADCADGMLARLRGGGSLTGYLFDGLADYATNTAVLIGMLVGLNADGERTLWVWLVGVPGGISYAWWCAMVDRFRNEWLGRVYGRRRDPQVELAELHRELATFPAGTHRWDRILAWAYGVYVRLWYSHPGVLESAAGREVPLALWQPARRPVMQAAVLLGPTMHLSLMILAGATNRVSWYFWFSLVVGTAWGLGVWAWRAAVDRRLTAAVAKGDGH
jgi:phosphatidylglycerophosphate synthase